ncbi:leukocyte immunoglobulin-like receptor subfamily A member 6 isoform X2 [Notamacropus eugenii]|uniref:leukocyte immunoglobulin-like receptor subfamily A member 6 isoform X2 n=1 Tax=Notamacropus eugenii TaxID=9315 RepID=UPI003B66E3D1
MQTHVGGHFPQLGSPRGGHVGSAGQWQGCSPPHPEGPAALSTCSLPAWEDLLGTMGPSLTALLCLNDLPAPRFEVEPNYPVPVGEALTLTCVGSYDSFDYRLWKEAVQEPLTADDSCWEGMSPVFHYPNVTAKRAGRFRCLYLFHDFWSKLSEPLDVAVAGLYEKPFLWATPGLSVPLGETVTFRCNSSVGLDKFVLYHGDPEDGFKVIKPQNIKNNEAVIHLRNKTQEMNGNYRCYGYMSSEPHHWSAASDILVLSGVDLPPGYCTTIHLIHVVLALAPLGVLLT